MAPARRALGIAALALVLAAVVGALGWRAAQRPEPMATDAFARALRGTASVAHETRYLAELLLDDRLTDAYARTHREKLVEELDGRIESLGETLPPALAAPGERARRAARELRAALVFLEGHLADPAGIRDVRAEADRTAHELAALEPAK